MAATILTRGVCLKRVPLLVFLAGLAALGGVGGGTGGARRWRERRLRSWARRAEAVMHEAPLEQRTGRQVQQTHRGAACRAAGARLSLGGVSVPRIEVEIVDTVQPVPLERIHERVVEQVVNLFVPQINQGLVKVVQISQDRGLEGMPQEHIRGRKAALICALPCAAGAWETLWRCKRVSERDVEKSLDLPLPEIFGAARGRNDHCVTDR